MSQRRKERRAKRRIADTNPDIGELRSRLATCRPDSQGWAQLRQWAEATWTEDPIRFEDQWLRYLLDHTAHWPTSTCRAPGYWLKYLIQGVAFTPMLLAKSLIIEDHPHARDNPALWETLRDNALLTHIESLRCDIHHIHLLCLRSAHDNLHSLHSLQLNLTAKDRFDTLDLLESPIIAQLATLRLLLSPYETSFLKALPELPKLTSLRVHCKPAPYERAEPILEALGASLNTGVLPSLACLSLVECSLATPDEAHARAALATLANQGTLVELDLSGSTHIEHLDPFRDFGLNLRSLNLSGSRTHHDWSFANWIARRLDDPRPLAALTSLNLSHTCPGRHGLQTLAKRYDLNLLRRLDLSNTAMTREGLSALARWPLLGQLDELRLEQNAFGAEDWLRFTESEHFHEGLRGAYTPPSPNQESR